AGGGDDRKVTIWESNGWKEKETLKDPDLTVTALAFSPDSQLLAVASNNLSIALWSVENGNLSRILR
ncbi:MAG: WD40 repeat domain-containing protein, partial [Pyrinomonadaceae bacterium]